MKKAYALNIENELVCFAIWHFNQSEKTTDYFLRDQLLVIILKFHLQCGYHDYILR